MKWFGGTGPIYIIILLGLISLFFTFFDIIFNKDWIFFVLGLYMVLIVFSLLVFYYRNLIKKIPSLSIKEFEKMLKGGLFHYKCPSCNGIFAIKKSKSNNKKPFLLTCPDCGFIATIPSYPKEIKGDIPEKKSTNANFRCFNCGEGITIWAEGTKLFSDVNVYSCPFCGNKENLRKI